MPRFDGTGPIGKGSFTGKGVGYCIKKLDSENIKIKKIDKEVFNMPRGDGTGPMGQGPMTGRGAGYCAGFGVPGYANSIPGGGYFGRGRGFFGRGGGRGRGFRNWYYATGLPGWLRAGYGYPAFGGGVNPFYSYEQEFTPKQEAEALKNEAVVLKEQLEDIQSRIETLEKTQTQENKDE